MMQGEGACNREGADFGLKQSLRDIRAFFQPRSGIALVGRVDVSAGWRATYSGFGSSVKIGFVNPKGGDGGDLPVYRSIMDLPDDFDTVVIRVSPERVPSVVRECGEKGFRTVLVFTNGFAETGAEGTALQAALADAAAESGVRLIGPNTPTGVLEQIAQPPGHRGGQIGLITQSGANGRLLVQGVSMGAAFGRWVSTGNEADLEAADFINYYAYQEEFSVICMYIEGFKSIGRLRAALENANEQNKPVIVLKIGATERGAMAATSHTGHLAGADAAIAGLFDQYGVTRVHDLDALLETSNLFAKVPLGTGLRCAMYSYSGGAAAIMGELGEVHGIEMPALADKTRDELLRYIITNFGIKNPIDNGGLLLHEHAEKRWAVLDAIASDPSIDIIVVGFGTGQGHLSEVMANDLLEWAPSAPKPVVAIWAAAATKGQAYENLVASGVPIFHSFTRCFEALRDFGKYAERQRTFRRRKVLQQNLTAPQKQALGDAGVLSGKAATVLAKEAGIRLARDSVAVSAAAAATAARDIGDKVVLKICSPDFPHKTDAGLVRLDVSAERAGEVAAELLTRAHQINPDAAIEGVQVQEMVDKGVEMILGLSRDPQCGMCLTLGFGGVYAELLRDVVTRPLPIDAGDILDMISQLRLAPLLNGWRGAPPADKQALVEMALQLAALGMAAEPALVELDLNPVMVLPEGAVAVDILAVSA